jgi:hypothetical protein
VPPTKKPEEPRREPTVSFKSSLDGNNEVPERLLIGGGFRLDSSPFSFSLLQLLAGDTQGVVHQRQNKSDEEGDFDAQPSGWRYISKYIGENAEHILLVFLGGTTGSLIGWFVTGPAHARWIRERKQRNRP